jgi:hypothetical protein
MHHRTRNNEQTVGRASTYWSTRWIAAGAFVFALAAGCQALMPSKLTTFGEDRRILKQAEHDPFPSPADVGIEAPKAKK